MTQEVHQERHPINKVLESARKAKESLRGKIDSLLTSVRNKHEGGTPKQEKDKNRQNVEFRQWRETAQFPQKFIHPEREGIRPDAIPWNGNPLVLYTGKYDGKQYYILNINQAGEPVVYSQNGKEHKLAHDSSQGAYIIKGEPGLDLAITYRGNQEEGNWRVHNSSDNLMRVSEMLPQYEQEQPILHLGYDGKRRDSDAMLAFEFRKNIYKSREKGKDSRVTESDDGQLTTPEIKTRNDVLHMLEATGDINLQPGQKKGVRVLYTFGIGGRPNELGSFRASADVTQPNIERDIVVNVADPFDKAAPPKPVQAEITQGMLNGEKPVYAAGEMTILAERNDQGQYKLTLKRIDQRPLAYDYSPKSSAQRLEQEIQRIESMGIVIDDFVKKQLDEQISYEKSQQNRGQFVRTQG